MKINFGMAILLTSLFIFLVAGYAGDEGLVGYWNFDEGKGSIAKDSSKKGNNGEINDAEWVKGIKGNALQFDGKGYVDCGEGESLNITKAITIEAWIKLGSTDFKSYPTIARKENAYALRFGGTKLGLILWMGGSPSARVDSQKSDWEADKWYYVAVTYDGSQIKLFIDGAEEKGSSKSQTGEIDASGNNCCIGASAGQYPFNGIIDEVRIYNRALSESEIKESYQRAQQKEKVETPKKEEIKQKEEIAKTVKEEVKISTQPKGGTIMSGNVYVWVDTEDFSNYGGWRLETYFVHLMGSAYLLAAGIGNPVKDATVEIEIPEDGKYRLWARCKNWIPQYTPGKFKIVLNDSLSSYELGTAKTDNWTWQQGGEFDLKKGKTKIALHDLTGWYGRADAIILTKDLIFTPPEQVDEIKKLRSKLTGKSLEPKLVGEFDVIVVGGGAAGCFASIASVRTGAKTALIQNRPILGGNASEEIGVSLNGATVVGYGAKNARESGIIEELGREKARRGYSWSKTFEIATKKEPNLSVFLNQHVFDVEKKDKNVISAAKSVNVLTGEISLYRGKMFIDCTGDGDLGFYAGAEYRIGREARSEFDESLAPEKPDTVTMSGCLWFSTRDAGKPVEFTAPEWAPKFLSDDELPQRDHEKWRGMHWWIERPGNINPIKDAEKSRDELIKINIGWWDHIKNYCKYSQEAKNYELINLTTIEGKRESRRLVGDYIINQNDAQNAVLFPDRVAYGGWPLDIHHPEGIFSGKKGQGPFDYNARVPLWSIPYRALYSKNIDNLLFAARNMSVTHTALGSVRVQSTLSVCGQAAGTAGGMCIKYNTTPRGIYQKYIKELQQTLLKNDAYMIGIKNEDPLDLARQSKLIASSTKKFSAFNKESIKKSTTIHPLNMPRAVMFPVEKNTVIKSISLFLISENSGPTDITLGLRESSKSEDFGSTEDIVTSEATIPSKGQHWVEFPLNCKLKEDYGWAYLPKTDGVSWSLMDSAMEGTTRAYGNSEKGPWTTSGGYYAHFLNPPAKTVVDCGVENIISGVTRPEGSKLNMWVSDPEQPMPQWVEMDFGKPMKFNSIYLVFDTDLNCWDYASYHKFPRVPECVKDYELFYWDGKQWVSIEKVQLNYQRLRVHKFNPVTVSKLKVEVQATNGDKSARIYEIRVYNE